MDKNLGAWFSTHCQANNEDICTQWHDVQLKEQSTTFSYSWDAEELAGLLITHDLKQSTSILNNWMLPHKHVKHFGCKVLGITFSIPLFTVHLKFWNKVFLVISSLHIPTCSLVGINVRLPNRKSRHWPVNDTEFKDLVTTDQSNIDLTQKKVVIKLA